MQRYLSEYGVSRVWDAYLTVIYLPEYASGMQDYCEGLRIGKVTCEVRGREVLLYDEYGAVRFHGRASSLFGWHRMSRLQVVFSHLFCLYADPKYRPGTWAFADVTLYPHVSSERLQEYRDELRRSGY